MKFAVGKKQRMSIVMIFLCKVPMFTYSIQVRLKDTDATGVLYFAEQFRMAMEAFEEFLKDRGFALSHLLESPYLMPVVHAAADFLAPVMVGDELRIALKIIKLGTSSVTLQYTFYDPLRKIDVGRVEIVHVVVDRETRSSTPIPEALRRIFELEVNVPLELRS